MFNSINSFMSGLSIRASFDSFYSLILCFEEIVKLSWPLNVILKNGLHHQQQ